MTYPQMDGPRLTPKSGATAKQLVVILHGYGADGNDLIDLGRAWAASLPDAEFVAPDAPEPLPHEALGGRQWFALHDRDMREYRLGAESAKPSLDAFLDRELKRLGLSEKDLAIVGFSQGAMMALHTGLRRQTPPAALLAFSGLLPGPDQLNNIQTYSPVMLIHGNDDDVVPAYHLEGARAALEKSGVHVEAHLLEGLDHSIDERAMVLGGRFLNQHFASPN